MICRPAGRLTFKPDELKAGQIKPINKGVDDANRIVFANPVLQAFRKQRALAAILALNKALHLIPASQRGNLNARITPRAAFSHSQDPERSSPDSDLSHSALTDCTVQLVGMLPTPAVDATAVPFMNHIAVLPRLSRQRRSLLPSPL